MVNLFGAQRQTVCENGKGEMREVGGERGGGRDTQRQLWSQLKSEAVQGTE